MLRRFSILVFVLSACGGASSERAAAPKTTLPPPSETKAEPAEATPDPVFPENEDFRNTQPEATAPRPLNLPTIQTFQLKNGVEVYLVERHELPTVALDLTFPGGSITDPAGKEGLASLCMDLVTEGTEKLSKLAFAESLADIASQVSSFASVDEQGVSMSTLSKNLDATLELWSDALQHPGLRQEELDRLAKERLDSLAQAKASAPSIASRVMPSVAWGERHPYARIVTEGAIKGVKLADCKKLVGDTFKPQGAKLYVVGDMTRAQVEEKIGGRLSMMKGKTRAAPKIASAAPRNGKIFFVDVPGAPQSVVWFMEPGPTRQAKDYFPTSIMSAILGGGFSSRINMNIREKNGYAYGARGGFSYLRTGSFFSAGGSMRADVTKEAILEVFKEIKGMVEGEATDVELGREKSGAILALPGVLATGSDVLSTFRRYVYFGLPLNYLESVVPGVQAVTKAEVKKAARDYLHPDKLRLLVVGDGKTVLPRLQELTREKTLDGAIVVLDADGKVVK